MLWTATIGEVASDDHCPAGTCPGVTTADVAAGPVPMALVAATRNVYAVPLVKPAIEVLVGGGAPLTVTGAWAAAPIKGVTEYEVIGLPLAGDTHDTKADALAALADTPVGALGWDGAEGVTAFEGARIIVGDGRVIENGTFIVSGAKITQIGGHIFYKMRPGTIQVALLSEGL